MKIFSMNKINKQILINFKNNQCKIKKCQKTNLSTQIQIFKGKKDKLKTFRKNQIKLKEKLYLWNKKSEKRTLL